MADIYRNNKLKIVSTVSTQTHLEILLKFSSVETVHLPLQNFIYKCVTTVIYYITSVKNASRNQLNFTHSLGFKVLLPAICSGARDHQSRALWFLKNWRLNPTKVTSSNILISSFCECTNGFQGLSKAFHYPIQVFTFLFAFLKLL